MRYGRPIRLWIVCGFSLWVLANWTPPLGAAKPTLRVFAAASLADAFSHLAHEFERRQPAVSVQVNLAGSQQLAAQLDQGARADVLATADGRWMEYARSHDWLAASPSIFATNRLVAIVPKTNPARIGRLQDLARRGIKLVTAADAVPVGHYTRQVLANLSRDPAFGANFSSRVLANVVSEEENVRSIVGRVQLGEADAGIVYRSDVTPALACHVRTFQIPDSANVVASYPIAVLRRANLPREAQAFVALVLSPEGQRLLARSGFTTAGATK